MIESEPKNYIHLEKPLRIEVNPRTIVKFEKGFVFIYTRGNAIKLTEWEFDEIATTHAHQRIKEIAARHRKDHKK